MELDLSEHIQRMVYLGAYERWETGLVRRHLRTGMCFIDIGANVGYFTVLAARAVGPSGRVIAVEPSGYAADRLARTVAENRLGNVWLERVGLGRQAGEVTLYDPLPDNHTPTMLGEAGTPGIIVPVRRLDDCLDDWDVDRVDLMKMDVEGYEPAVLEGAAAALAAGRVRALLCEFNAHWLARAGNSTDALRSRILGFGFTDVTGTRWDPAAPVLNRLFVLPDGAGLGSRPDPLRQGRSA
jgi:FkbM family methyltransferase